MANTEVGSAYVSIYANISKQFGSSIDGAVKSAVGKFGSLAATAGKVAAGASAAVATGLGAIGKMALDSYASYEQLSGGVDKLYGDAADKLRGYAQQAYATAGMSANQYMEQATSFSAALISSLGGDQQKAAEMTDVAMRAMSDNVNVFGSNMEDVQNALQGFAKQNYTMLDNLKLGYGGTKEEMQRLIDDANAYAEANGKAADLSIDSFADIVQAIQYVQEAQGVAGTTAKEAATTIEGSVNMAKAAWANLLTELGKDDGDVTARVEELMESVTAVVSNVTPVVQRIGEGLAAAMPELIPAALELGGQVVTAMGQVIAGSAPVIAESIGQALREAWEGIPMPEGVREQLEGVFATVSAIASDAVSAIRSLAPHFQPIIDSLGRMGEELLPLVAPLLEHLAQTAGEHLMPALEYLGDALGYLMEQLEPWMPHLVNVAAIIGDGLIVALSALVYALGIAANIIGTVLEAGTAFCDFVEGMPETIGGAVEAVTGFFDGLDKDACAALDSAGSAVDGWTTDVSNWFAGLDSDISTSFEGMKASVGSWATDMDAKAREAGASFVSSVQTKFDEAVAFFQDLPNRISNAVGNLGNLLWNAGWDAINGFIGGAVQAWNDMCGFFSGIGGWIQEHKGPIEYDRKLLTGHGEAIMQGLDRGLQLGYRDVKGTVLGMAPGIAASAVAGWSAAPQAAGAGDTYNITVHASGDGQQIARAIRDELHAWNLVHGRW